MGVRTEDMLVGVMCLVLALVNAWRLWSALGKGEIPLYRTRLRKAEVGAAKYGAAVALNVALLCVLLVIAADLMLGLDLRGR